VAVSNQQPPYGQPQQPYGQPQYGQPQYGGYPPPPPPSGSNKTVLIVFTVVVAMVVLGAGIFVVSRFAGGSDDTAGGTTTVPASPQPTDAVPSQPADSPTASTGGSPTDEPTTQPSKPAAGCDDCLPGVTLNSLLKAFKSKGYICKLDSWWNCDKGNISVRISPHYQHKSYVEDVDISGGSSAKVKDCPQCIKGAVAALKQGLPGVLEIFVKDAAVRQQIVTFALQGAGLPAAGPSSHRDATAGAYRLSTMGYSGATVGKNGKYSSYYSTSVGIRAV